jgi:two-component system, NtrC family, sensor kinase
MPPAATIKSGKQTILLVEDDVSVLGYLTRQIEKRGYSVLKAENGITAWDLFLLEKPSLIISDIYMPELNGLELLKRVMHLTPELPFIIMSGAGTMDDVISALRLGAWDYITKPIEGVDIFFFTIEKALEWARLKKLSLEYQEMLEVKVLEKTTALLEELNARKAVEKHLEQAKREWEQTFNAIPDLIALVDENKRIVRANKAMASALDVSPAKTAGKEISLLFNGRWPQINDPSPAESETGDRHHNIEIFDEVRKRYFELSVIPYLDPDSGLRIGSIHIARDIHTRKEVEQEKERMHLQLLQAQKLESVGQLAAGIAHEINTPVQYVSTNMDFLGQAFTDLSEVMHSFYDCFEKTEGNIPSAEVSRKMQQTLADADWKYLEKEIPTSIDQSKEELSRVSSIVRAMKEFTHPGSKEAELVDLAHIIETTIIVARNEWKYVAEIITDYDKDLPKVVCVAEELGQVILHLLINAAHAIEEKLGENPEGGKGAITIGTRADGRFAEIHISDNGIGIPEAIRNRIFDPFFTTKKVGRGTGQGLAIVHNVITEKHQGSIAVESARGQGTTFVLRLPLTNEEEGTTTV